MNLAAQGIQIVGQILLQLLLEEVGQDLCAGVIALLAQAGLGLGTQEGLTDILTVQLHIQQSVAEQGAAGRSQVLGLDHAVVAGQILTAEPLADEADLVGANVLVGDKDVQCVGAIEHLL